MRKLSFLLLCIFINSCSTPKATTSKQTLTFNSHLGSFQIDTPTGWTKIKVQGVDSYVGRIAINANDTLMFDLGYYSNDLTEREPDDFDGDDYSKYSKTKISFGTINGHFTKFVIPKKHGIGMSGIYVDSLWMDKEDKVKFNLYGNNLSKESQKHFFEVVKTLKFTKPK
jgi:hypothetical protein